MRGLPTFAGVREGLPAYSQLVLLLTVLGTWILGATEAGFVFADQSSEDGIQYFETRIRPLLAERCYGCHSIRADKQEGGLRLDHRDGWLKGGERGRAVVPGDARASLLIQAIRYTDPDFQMPPKEKLPDEAVAALETWIKMGAPAPEKDVAIELTRPSDPIAGKSHWAFQPLKRVVAPAVQDPQWPRSEIDRFILAWLEREQLQPVSDAAPIDLIRRLSFQLVGVV